MKVWGEECWRYEVGLLRGWDLEDDGGFFLVWCCGEKKSQPRRHASGWQGSQSREAAVPADHSSSSRYESKTTVLRTVAVVGYSIQYSSSGTPLDLGTGKTAKSLSTCGTEIDDARFARQRSESHAIPNSPYPHIPNPAES
jgi:hypothetical protein